MRVLHICWLHWILALRAVPTLVFAKELQTNGNRRERPSSTTNDGLPEQDDSSSTTTTAITADDEHQQQRDLIGSPISYPSHTWPSFAPPTIPAPVPQSVTGALDHSTPFETTAPPYGGPPTVLNWVGIQPTLAPAPWIRIEFIPPDVPIIPIAAPTPAPFWPPFQLGLTGPSPPIVILPTTGHTFFITTGSPTMTDGTPVRT